MKINTLFLLLLLVLPFTVSSQVDNLGDLFQQAGEEFNEENALGSQPENNRSQNQNNAPSPEDRARMDQWKEMFEAMTADMSEAMKYFNTPGTKCVFAMVIYLDMLLKLDATVQATDDLDCQNKYDGYGLLAMAWTMSTTIINCPEGIYKMSWEDRSKVYNDLKPVLRNENNSQVLKSWIIKWQSITLDMYPQYSAGYDGASTLFDLSEVFNPFMVLEQLLLIQKEMEALPCGD